MATARLMPAAERTLSRRPSACRRRRPGAGRRGRGRAIRRRARARVRRARRSRGTGSGPRGRRRRPPRWRRCTRTERAAAPPASQASPSSGNVSWSGSWNSSDERRAGRAAARASPRARGYVSAYEIGTRMSGQPEVRERGAVAEADERVDGRGRMHDDLDPVVREPEEEVRLDHLEALVRERGGVDRDLRPHRPGRVRERLLDRDVRELRRASRPRNGPPEAVSTSECTCSGSRPSRHCSVAECSLSTGSSAPPPRCARRGRELAGRDEALLVREREVDAALERPERRADPGEADDRVEDDVGLGPLEQLGRVTAHLGQRREPVDRRRARRGCDELQLGLAATISRAWRPMEPVAPSSATRVIPVECARRLRVSEGEQEVERRPARRQRSESRGRARPRARRAAGRCP